jgi:large subunit ribosomal protein L32
MVQMKKRTKSETRGRRSHHALKAKTLVKCPQCGQMALPHTVCAFCGTYKGRQVVKDKTAKKTIAAKTVKSPKKAVVKKTAPAKVSKKETIKNK